MILPMFPLRKPPSARPTSANQKLVEIPTNSSDNIVPAHPSSRTGFRPMRSDRPPQYLETFSAMLTYM